MQRLLILSCSQRKRHDPGLLPAVERYDGPMFRLVRRYQARSSDHLQVYVLSALLGLIHGEETIPTYDHKMTPQRALELQPQISEKMRKIIKAVYQDDESAPKLLLCMGKAYLDALKDFIPAGISVEHASGSIGKKLSKLHAWLYGSDPGVTSCPLGHASPVPVRLHGVEIRVTARDALDQARQALSTCPKGADNYQSWYVLIDDRRVSPKWLVGLLAELPVSTFHSDEARRLLAMLGIEVHRT